MYTYTVLMQAHKSMSGINTCHIHGEKGAGHERGRKIEVGREGEREKGKGKERERERETMYCDSQRGLL